MKFSMSRLLSMSAGLCAAVVLLATTPRTAQGRVPAHERAEVRHLLSMIHHVNQMEIEMVQLAMQRGRTAAVRDYGRRLRNDHRVADRRLLRFAASEGIPIVRYAPRTRAELQHARLERRAHRDLRGTWGIAFDRAFARIMAQGHDRTIALLTRARSRLDDRETREFVRDVLPTLREHRRHARDVGSRV